MAGRVASSDPATNQQPGIRGRTRKSGITWVGAALALAFALAPRPAASATRDAGEILRKVSSVYSRLQNYHIVAVVEDNGVKSGKTFSRRRSVTLDAAGLGRLRLSLESESSKLLIVANGGTTWYDDPSTNEYTEKVAGTAQVPGAIAEDPLEEMQELLVGRFTRLLRFEDAAKFQGRSKIKFQGRKVRCYHIAVNEDGFTEELWIHPSAFLVLRETETQRKKPGVAFSGMSSALSVAEFDLDPERSAGFFTFTPPPGARRVARLDIPGVPAGFVGSPAEDFTLPDLEGRQVSLSDFRGKTVLLSFWATWCAPCRMELPGVEGIYEQYQGKDVVVLAVDDEDKATEKSFLKDHHYGFTALVDRKRTLFKKFAVYYIPTVFVINDQGIIVQHKVGFQSPQQLLEAVKTGEP